MLRLTASVRTGTVSASLLLKRLGAYGTLPPAGELIELTPAEWQSRLANPTLWGVDGGKLVAVPMIVPPVPLAIQAQAALEASDLTAIRCLKAGVAFPAEWQAYCTTLRAIVGGGAAEALPPRPDYPAGT